MNGKPVVMGAKSDTLEKHAGKRQAKVDLPHLNVKKDEYNINPKCGHLKDVPIYNAQSLNWPTILQQVSVFHLSQVFSFHIFLYAYLVCFSCVYQRSNLHIASL